MTKKTSYLSKNDTIGAMIAHPAFRGFGHLLLPWNDRMDLDLPLSRNARLLPYHSHVDVDTVAQALNRMIDAANAAIDFIGQHADEWGVDRQNYSFWGSSTGACVVANISANGLTAYGGKSGIRPRAVVMAYTGHAGYSENDALTFSIVGEQDYIADPEVMRRRAQKMSGLGIPVAFKVIPGLGHGFGLGTGTRAEGWINEAVRFWERQSE